MPTPPPWLGPERAAWLTGVEAWVRDAAASAGLGAVESIVPVKEQPWGAVVRVRTASATAFFKTPGHVGRHELRIIRDISSRWVRLAPDLLAFDESRRWMLLADHGVPVRDALDVTAQLAAIEQLLPSYADMQASTTALVPSWLGAGAPDRRVDRLPELLDLLLRGATPVGPLRIDDGDLATYRAVLPLLERVCADLATTDTPDALDHADLHGTNVLVDATGHRLIDWGDSCISHPFSTLAVSYELVVASLPHAERRRASTRLRDVYLERWGSTAAHREMFGLAVWVAHVTRAVNIAHETLGETDDHGEIASLLGAWHAKQSLLGRPDDVIVPT